MMYRLTLPIILLLLVVSGVLAQSAPDTSYVRQDELEPGFGLLWINVDIGNTGSPKNVIDIAAISPKGTKLAYSENGILKVKDLITGSITIMGSPCYDAQWSPTGDTLMFTMWGKGGFNFWEVASSHISWLFYPQDSSLGICSDVWAPDGALYFPSCNVRTNDSIMWKMLIDSSLQANRYIYRFVDTCDNLPFFSPGSVKYQVLGVYDQRQSLLEEFDVATDFVFDKRRTIRIVPPDTSWAYSRSDIWNPRLHASHIIVGTNGDLYAYLSFRAKQERLHQSFPIDSVDSAARNACGWYHIDTAGHGLTQLIRSWTPDLPLSVTADGQKIYYAFLNPDSTMAVWEMDRFGRNKRQVTTPLEGIADVREPAAERNPSPDNRIECVLNAGEVILRWHDVSEAATVDVADVQGMIVRHETVGAERDQIVVSTGSLLAGAYFVTVRSKGVIRTGRFIITH